MVCPTPPSDTRDPDVQRHAAARAARAADTVLCVSSPKKHAVVLWRRAVRDAPSPMDHEVMHGPRSVPPRRPPNTRAVFATFPPTVRSLYIFLLCEG